MKKNVIFPLIIAVAAVLVIGLFVVLFKLKTPTISNDTMVFFYSDTCPHCANVEGFFAANAVEQKTSFEKLNVHNSTENAKLFSERATQCGIAKEDLGVPLLWTGTECIGGDQPIIDYFKTKLGI